MGQAARSKHGVPLFLSLSSHHCCAVRLRCLSEALTRFQASKEQIVADPGNPWPIPQIDWKLTSWHGCQNMGGTNLNATKSHLSETSVCPWSNLDNVLQTAADQNNISKESTSGNGPSDRHQPFGQPDLMHCGGFSLTQRYLNRRTRFDAGTWHWRSRSRVWLEFLLRSDTMWNYRSSISRLVLWTSWEGDG